MSKPRPGATYTIVDEDTLSLVARRAYGDASLWPRIWSANKAFLRSGNPDLIYPGEQIIIPELHERALPTGIIGTRDPLGMYVNLDGYELRPMTGRIIRTLDTVADAFTLDIPWEYGVDPELDKKIWPYSYTKTTIHLGETLVFQGVLYTTTPSISGGTQVSLAGASKTADIVDSSVKPPLEYSGISLEELTRQQVEPLGFSVSVQADTGGAFDTVTATEGQKIFDFLVGLARQRALLLTCDSAGNVLIMRAKTKGVQIATIEEGVTPGVTGWGMQFDGRQRFNTYRAIGQSPLGNNESVVKDKKVPRSRSITVSADESTMGNIENAALWARNKTLADGASFVLTLPGWYTDDGRLWDCNEFVTVKSKTMFIPGGFDFLISRVEFGVDAGGVTTALTLVPPTVYTNGDIKEPW